MKLLLVNYEYPPVGGGAAVATRSLARALHSAGHKVVVLTAATSSEPPVRVEGGVTVHRVACLRRGVHDIGLFGAFTFLVTAAWRMPSILRGAAFDCALFYFVVPTGLLAPLWSLLARRPYVVALRGSDVPGYAEDPALVGLHAVLKPVTAGILRRASHVVANSDGLRDLARLAFVKQPVLVIANGVESANFSPESERRQQPAAVRALCVARLIHRKGIDLLLSALGDPRCRNVELDLVGSGPALDDLVAACRAAGLESRVNFLGHVDNGELPRIYRRADLFVLPSRSESCSMALLEAMASGLPVVATRIGGTPELVQDGLNGFLVPVDDVEALAHRMGQIADCADLRHRMGAASREVVNVRHSWNRVADGYMRLFAESAG